MFLYNLKLNGNRIIKFLFIVMLIVILLIFSFGIYKIFFQEQNQDTESDIMQFAKNKTFEISPENYTNILQAANEDIDSYIGTKIHFTGYVYRLIDFKEDEFVLARDMLINENTNQSLVVGFFSKSKEIKNYKDGTWIDITGTIQKGNYHGELAQINVETITQTQEPENKYVTPPTTTYIPTANMF